jgi:serine protease SohB
MFGENTEEGREKFKDDLANIHELFKKHVAKYRPTLDVNKVATGEVWQGIEAIDVGLVDKIQTSDSYLIEQNKKFDIFEVSFKPKKNMQDRFSRFLSFSITKTINKIFENFSKQKFI